MRSPYEQSIDLEGLHPRLATYFSAIPLGKVGRGEGVFEAIGTPRRWLWPALWVLAKYNIVFPVWEHGVRFMVSNTPTPAGLASRRTFLFERGARTMVDFMCVEGGNLVDYLGSSRNMRAQFVGSTEDHKLELSSTAVTLVVGRFSLPLPVRVRLTEEWRDDHQAVSVSISAPLVGRVYEYSGTFTYEVLDE